MAGIPVITIVCLHSGSVALRIAVVKAVLVLHHIVASAQINHRHSFLHTENMQEAFSVRLTMGSAPDATPCMQV